MAFAETVGDRRIGKIQIYGKTFATPAADEDWNSISGFTELFEVDLDTPANINFVEEFKKRQSAAFLAPVGEDLIGQDLNMQLTAKVVNLEHVAKAFGLLTSSVADKTGDDPTRLQLGVGGHRVLNWYNLIIRQRHPTLASKYVGWHFIKVNIRAAGAIPFSIKEEQEIPIFIQAVCLMSGDHAEVLAYPYEEYGAAGPAIATILPASKSVSDGVCINGSGFGSARGASKVTFHDAKDAVTYLHWSDSSISVVIPADATTGDVKVTVGGTASAGVAYTIV